MSSPVGSAREALDWKRVLAGVALMVVALIAYQSYLLHDLAAIQ